MISFDEERVSSLRYEIKSIYIVVKKLSLALDEVSHKLPRCMDSENIEKLLWKADQELKTHAIYCSRLWRSLEEICELYENCELYISDAGEGAIIEYTQSKAYTADLSDEKGILDELSFSLF